MKYLLLVVLANLILSHPRQSYLFFFQLILELLNLIQELLNFGFLLLLVRLSYGSSYVHLGDLLLLLLRLKFKVIEGFLELSLLFLQLAQ